MSAALKDLLLGARFAVAGGRDGWTRAVLTAVGVGVGVALLLLAASVPQAFAARQARDDARSDLVSSGQLSPGANTVLLGYTDTEFRGDAVRGRLLRAEGTRPPVPPGVARFPGPGEVVVSPALKALLDSPDGRLFAPRLRGARVIGTIADAGLSGPGELAFYLGDGALTERATARIDRFGQAGLEHEGLSPLLVLLVVIIFVVLLLPIAVFLASAVRFGGERRDQRLAALRLIGADPRMTRRIAAGEATAGALLGLGVGALLFLAGRQVAPFFTVWDVSVFAADVRPGLPLTALIVVAVPVVSVAAGLAALRGVAIEPLGVTRRATVTRRRLWWRLIPPAAGLLVLAPMLGDGGVQGSAGQYQAAAGAVLLLLGAVALLPWLIDLVVRRLGGGPVGWQLAVRRLRFDSGTPVRLVNGITVAVAGTIGLQMLFAGAQSQSITETGHDAAGPQVIVQTHTFTDRAGLLSRLRSTPGVTAADASVRLTTQPARPPRAGEALVELREADCASLAHYARLGRCSPGDVFLVRTSESDSAVTAAYRPGARLTLGDDGGGGSWTLPARTRVVTGTQTYDAVRQDAVLVTPGVLRPSQLAAGTIQAYVWLSPGDPDALERLRNTAVGADPLSMVGVQSAVRMDRKFDGIRRGLYIGAVITLLLIAASMLIGVLEQLRERRRLLAMLVAVGTRRGTLSWSVLWQTAVPVLIGMVLAVVFGLALGAVLMSMVQLPLSVSWPVVGGSAGLGAAVVLLVTALSLPALWRLTRPEGLRTE
ncbi:ABC transporter permease [Microbispora sp. RL4-1S]|uniref:ABC transporter permease n=1 Tax=Microbispora oryzae TaxID=2806554 RepID=A0A940WI82_9ACTN|nr:ABC transporter permease [Microbispora oryzae]MBP2705383.1 ABC transporter permease [Microbispora oryzae]